MGEVSTLWSLDADSSEASASLDELIGSLDALESSVTSAAAGSADLDALGESLANAATGGSALDDTASALATSIGAITDSATAAAGSVDTLGGSSDAASGQLDALSGSADAAAGSLDTVAGSAGGAAVATDAAAVSTDGLSKGLNMVKMPALIAGVAIVAAGAIATKMAGDFQASMTQLVTGAGESQSNLQMVTNGILAMAPAVGESTGQLAKGMFMVESAGYHGKAGLAVLQAAAEGAKVGAADLGTVADATTTILNDFGSKGVTASNAVNLLVATVASGKTHMQDLAASLAQILPTAASANVGINDVMGAMATMTGEGVPAANAATYLRQTILALDSPSAAATKALQSVGLTTGEVSSTMQKSLPAAIQMITEAVGKKFPVGSAAYVSAIKNISGGVKTMQGMLDLSGSHMKTFQSNTEGITASVKKGGSSINGWAATQGDFNTKMDKLGATIEVAAIKIGGKLLPVLGHLATILTAHLPGAIAGVEKAFSFIGTHASTLAPIIGIVAGVIGGALVAALVASAIAAWTALVPLLIFAAPFIAIGAAIGLVIAAIVMLVTHWGQVKAFFENIWHTITSFVGRVWGAITGFFGRVAGAIGGAIQGWIHTAQTNIARVQHVFQAGFAFLVNLVEAPFRAIVGLFAWLYNHNHYFKDLVDFIRRMFTIGKDDIERIWHAITGWLAGAWNAIKATAQNAWAQVQQHIIQPIQRAVAMVEERINHAKALLAAAWAIITTDVHTAWTRFTDTIKNAVVTVATDISNLIDAIVHPIDGLAQTLFNAGVHMVQMLINGIKSMAGAVGNAAQGIAKNITSFLGFHSPTEKGPGATADQWMPALGAMLERDLLAQTARVQAAASKVAGAIATGIHSPAGAGAIGVSGGGAGALPPGLSSSLGGGAGVGGGSQAQLLSQLVEALRGGGNRAAPLGAPPTSATLGSVTQNFNGMNINGVSNVNEFFNAMNAIAGYAQENSLRGATQGLAL